MTCADPAAAHDVPGPGVRTVAVPPGPAFLDTCARHVIEAVRAHLPDLSGLVVVLPNQHIAPEFRRALARAAGQTIWMPQLFTLTGLLREPLSRLEKDTDAARLMRLYGVLEKQSIVGSLPTFPLAAELAGLFDELTARAACVPDSDEAFVEVLARGYGIDGNAALSLEAQFVRLLWRADCEGLPSLARALQQALGEYVDAYAPGVPMFLMCDGAPIPAERRFADLLGHKTPVHLFLPDRSADEADPLLATLNAAWPLQAGATLDERARALVARHPGFSLAGRVRFMPTASLEQEAAAVAQTVRRRIEAGVESIAVIAADRVAARRARAALANQGIEVLDETGWLLSTTRAAAFVDALLELVVSGGYHRAVLDLAKSPFFCADWDTATKDEALHGLEQLIGQHNFVSGLFELDRLVSRHAQGRGVIDLVARMRSASAALSGKSTTVVEWLSRLNDVFAQCGASAALTQDAAGSEVCALLALRANELAGQTLRLSFQAWREWLNGEFERTMFRDEAMTSPVVMTHLAAARLRTFDCAVVVGADRKHLSPQSGQAIFAHDAVRRELGLATTREARERLREDLVLLLTHCPDVLFTRQAMKGDELNLDAPLLEVLALLHKMAFGVGLEVPVEVAPLRGDHAGLSVQQRPAPQVAPECVPGRVSASGYASLVNCPYQFFARYVLSLGEQDAVREALEKRDYGDLVHAILHRFHRDYPALDQHDEAALVEALVTLTHDTFAQAVEGNFLERAWVVRWQTRIPEYVAWARARHASGWRWKDGERWLERPLELPDGASLTLQGRLDRIDDNGAGVAVLDYKTQSLDALKKKAKQGADVQLAFYGLLYPGAVREAAYVALDDDEGVKTLALPEVETQQDAHLARIKTVFADLRAGAALPAHGVSAVCGYCEMGGLCRKQHHQP